MFEVYDWVEYNGNPARIMNKNSKICYLVVLEDVNLPSQNTKRIKASNPDLKALDVPQFESGENAVYIGCNVGSLEQGSVVTIVKQHQKQVYSYRVKQGDKRAILTPFELQKINY
jgi:hypothetical protein